MPTEKFKSLGFLDGAWHTNTFHGQILAVLMFLSTKQQGSAFSYLPNEGIAKLCLIYKK